VGSQNSQFLRCEKLNENLFNLLLFLQGPSSGLYGYAAAASLLKEWHLLGKAAAENINSLYP
jgi:hypothetical protein